MEFSWEQRRACAAGVAEETVINVGGIERRPA